MNWMSSSKNGEQLLPVEIKSAASLNDNFFKNLYYWQKLTHHQGGRLVYSGTMSEVNHGNFIINTWKDVVNL